MFNKPVVEKALRAVPTAARRISTRFGMKGKAIGSDEARKSRSGDLPRESPRRVVIEKGENEAEVAMVRLRQSESMQHGMSSGASLSDGGEILILDKEKPQNEVWRSKRLNKEPLDRGLQSRGPWDKDPWNETTISKKARSKQNGAGPKVEESLSASDSKQKGSALPRYAETDNDALKARLEWVAERHEMKIKHIEKRHQDEKDSMELMMRTMDRAARRHKEESEKKSTEIERLKQQLNQAKTEMMELARIVEMIGEDHKELERIMEISKQKMEKMVALKQLLTKTPIKRGGDILILENNESHTPERQRTMKNDAAGRPRNGADVAADIEESASGSDSETEGFVQPSQAEARKMIKQVCWPVLAHYSTEESWRRMFQMQIAKAVKMKIPGKIIANSVSQALIGCSKTAEVYSEMAEKYDTGTLSGIKKLIENLDLEQEPLDRWEQFEGIAMRNGESARSYLGRLRRASKSLFPNQKESNERIRKSFVKNFNWNGKFLSESDRIWLLCAPSLEDMVTRATERMKKKEREDSLSSKTKRGEKELNMMEEMPMPLQQPARQVMAPRNIMASQAMPQQQMIAPQAYNVQQMPDYQNPKMFRGGGDSKRPGKKKAFKSTNMRTSAGPHAARLSIAEYELGKAKNGESCCFRCCMTNHVATGCDFQAYCVYCEIEGNHPSIAHRHENQPRRRKKWGEE